MAKKTFLIRTTGTFDIPAKVNWFLERSVFLTLGEDHPVVGLTTITNAAGGATGFVTSLRDYRISLDPSEWPHETYDEAVKHLFKLAPNFVDMHRSEIVCNLAQWHHYAGSKYADNSFIMRSFPFAPGFFILHCNEELYNWDGGEKDFYMLQRNYAERRLMMQEESMITLPCLAGRYEEWGADGVITRLETIMQGL